jgi:hypothetical protein
MTLRRAILAIVAATSVDALLGAVLWLVSPVVNQSQSFGQAVGTSVGIAFTGSVLLVLYIHLRWGDSWDAGEDGVTVLGLLRAYIAAWRHQD